MTRTRFAMSRLGAPMLAALLASPLGAQSGPCFTNLVPNGDLESVFPAWFPSGPTTATFPTAMVNGIDDSRCVQLVPSGGSSFSIGQAQAFTLDASTTYEIAVDVVCNDSVWNLDVGISIDGSRTPLLVRRTGPGTQRIAELFTPASTGSYTIDIAVTSMNTLVQFDNLSIRPNDLLTTVDGRRVAGASHTLRVDGTPNSLFALALSPAQLGTGLPLPGWTGEFWLGSPLVWLPTASLDATGRFTTSLPIPASAAGVPLYWQSFAVPPPGSSEPTMGCPVMIGMPSP